MLVVRQRVISDVFRQASDRLNFVLNLLAVSHDVVFARAFKFVVERDLVIEDTLRNE